MCTYSGVTAPHHFTVQWCSPNSSSFSSLRESFLSLRSCLSISSLILWFSFSSADTQHPAIISELNNSLSNKHSADEVKMPQSLVKDYETLSSQPILLLPLSQFTNSDGKGAEHLQTSFKSEGDKQFAEEESWSGHWYKEKLGGLGIKNPEMFSRNRSLLAKVLLLVWTWRTLAELYPGES